MSTIDTDDYVAKLEKLKELGKEISDCREEIEEIANNLRYYIIAHRIDECKGDQND